MKPYNCAYPNKVSNKITFSDQKILVLKVWTLLKCINKNLHIKFILLNLISFQQKNVTTNFVILLLDCILFSVLNDNTFSPKSVAAH